MKMPIDLENITLIDEKDIPCIRGLKDDFWYDLLSKIPEGKVLVLPAKEISLTQVRYWIKKFQIRGKFTNLIWRSRIDQVTREQKTYVINSKRSE